jgi:putative DNA primase/helicase
MTPPPGTPPTSDDMFGSEYDRSEREFFAAHGMDADGDASPNGADREWPEPQPLGGELPPVAPMLEALLPEALRPLCADVAERMQVPLDFPAAASVLCLAGAVGRRAIIQPKAHDSGWSVVPNLWGCIIGPPGVMKSPLLRAVAAPLHCIAQRWRIEHESALADHTAAAEEAALRKRAWEQRAVAAAKKDEPMPLRPDDSAAPPAERRLVLMDATMEVLHQILAANPAGVLVLRDELTGWLAMLDRAGREGERAFYLSAWAGDMAHTIDRIGRGSIHVPHCCVSMLGGIQPARLRVYLADTLSGGPGDDGLMQRFQVAVWPDLAAEWRDVDRPPDSGALAAAEAMFLRLVQGDPDDPWLFRFGPEAQELFNAWRAELERRVRGDDMHPALTAHLAKYRSLMPSLALLFALADGGEEAVGLSHAQQAAAWCAYLESHARRVYSCVISPALRAAAELGRRIAGGWRAREETFTVRDVYRPQWSGLDTPELARTAIGVLEDAGWARRIALDYGADGGRPSEAYSINPRTRRKKE